MKKRFIIPIFLILILFTLSFIHYGFAYKGSIEADMKTLTSKEFMGRLPGTEGNEKAVSYISNRFSEIDLEFFDEDYFHISKQIMYKPEKQIHYLEVVFQDGKSKTYEFGKDYIDWFPVKEVNITAPITFNKDDQNINEKIIVLDKNDDIGKFYNNCKAIFRKTNSFFRVRFVRNTGTPCIEISEKLYNTLMTKNVSEVKLITKYIPTEVDIKNVVGKISGSDNSKVLVVSAHLDHVGWTGKTIYYGAVDNASGTSIIIDVAKKLMKYSEKESFDMDIIICAFNGEDSMLKSTDAFVRDIKSKYDEVYNINIDCIGKIDGGKITINGDKKLNEELIKDLTDCFLKNNTEVLDEYYGGSDHVIFNMHGICGVTIGQVDVLGENNTTSIHTPEDSLRIIDYSQLYKVSDIVYDFIITNNGKIYKPNNTN